MKNKIFAVIIGVICITLVLSFSITGCKTGTTTATTTAAETTTAATAAVETTAAATTTAAETTTTVQKTKIVFASWLGEEAVRVAWTKASEGFAKNHPEFEIEWLYIPAEKMKDTLITMAMGGNLPDVLYMGYPAALDLETMGALQDCNKLFPTEFLNEISNKTAATSSTGSLMGIPVYQASFGLHASKEILKNAGVDIPKTMDELLNACKKIKETQGSKGVYSIGIDVFFEGLTGISVFPFMWSFGAKPLEGETKFNTPEMKNFLEFFKELTVSGCTPPIGTNIREYREFQAKEKLGFYMDPAYNRIIFASLNPATVENYDDMFQGMAMPITDKVTAPQVAVDGVVLGIPTLSKNKEAAAKFVQEFLQDPLVVEFFLYPGGVPGGGAYGLNIGNKQIAEWLVENKKDKVAAAFKFWTENVEKGARLLPYSAYYSAGEKAIMVALQEVQQGKKSIDDIMVETENKLKEIYKE